MEGAGGDGSSRCLFNSFNSLNGLGVNHNEFIRIWNGYNSTSKASLEMIIAQLVDGLT